MELERKKLQTMFPHLSKELEGKSMAVGIESVRSDTEATERKKTTRQDFTGYSPDVIDFIRRCDTKEQAREIIAFLEKRSEISSEYGGRLREQLERKGLRSFGSKKEHDYYLKRAGYG